MNLVNLLANTPAVAADDGRVFVTVPADNRGTQSLPLYSRAFRIWFADIFTRASDVIPSPFDTYLATQHLAARALLASGPRTLRVPFRVGARGPVSAPSAILLDLADSEGRYVEIDPSGFHIASANDTWFEIGPSSLSIDPPKPTDPAAPSPLDALRDTLHLGAPNSPDWLRCLAWLLSTLRPDGPFPILLLRGPAASGKSFAARILRFLTDPCASPFTSLPATPRELLSLARQSWILAFDHVQSLTPALSATLCRIANGTGVALRETRGAEICQAWTKRPILLTVPDDFEPPADLASRALTVTLPALAPELVRPESSLVELVSPLVPRAVGELCTAISGALANRAAVTIGHFPNRHADTLAWALAAYPDLDWFAAFGTPPPPTPFASAIDAFAADRQDWSGTASQLLDLLPTLAPTPRCLSERLRRAVLTSKITFSRRHEGTRQIHLSASPELVIGTKQMIKIVRSHGDSASPVSHNKQLKSA